MTLFCVYYTRGGCVWHQSPYMTYEECRTEMERFNSLPIMSLERGAMTARIKEATV